MEKSAKRLMPSENSNDGSPPSKRHYAYDDSSVEDANPKIRKINEVLAVELLEMIVLCVPTKPTEKLWPQEKLSEITISRQFQLRYLCRLWRSIVYRNTKLAVVLIRTADADHDKMSKRSVEPAGFKFDQASELYEALIRSARRVADDSSWIEFITRVRLDWNGEKDDESTIAILTRLTKSIRHPVDLELSLSKANMNGTIKHNFRTPFATRFPNLALIKLEFFSVYYYRIFDRKEFIYSARLTSFYLKGARSCLVELDVNLFTLKKALTGLRTRRNGDSEPEDWTCNSLRRLRLWIGPLNAPDGNAKNAKKRDTVFTLPAKLPTWFPQLKQLRLDWAGPQVQRDFTLLQNFPVLNDLTLMPLFYAPTARHNCQLPSLPNIKTFSFSGEGIFPIQLAVSVPNVCSLDIRFFGRGACRDLARQLRANAASLQELRRVSLNCHQRETDWYPTREDVLDLLLALYFAPHLAEFELKNVCPPDFLGLLHVIPKGVVVKLTLDCCLKLDWVSYDDGRWFVWRFWQNRTRVEVEEAYKEWIRKLFCILADFVALTEFNCVVPTPMFRTVRNLVAQWRRNVPALLTDLNVNLTTLALQSIDFDPVDNSAKSLGLTAKLLASGDTPASARQVVAKLVFKDAK